ncbi:MAG: prephenate dehydratase [Fibrobacteres bacterium]|nr:prephenate dehydratase [Fibrobacterota bacterium]
MKAAFQGVHGAYSELASKQLLGSRVRTLPCESFADVFDAVAGGAAERGILPIENSLAGSIHQNYDLLLDRDLHIVGEAYLKVEHALLCHPSASLRAITEVRSHPQALAQCSGFFAKNKGIKPAPYFDTAGAAESLAREAPIHIGAIASAYAAELYGLKVLKRNLQNHADNFTRFLAVAKRPLPAKRSTTAGLPFKTSLAFMPKRNAVGSLHAILGVIAGRGIDLLKIESRPNPLSPFEYWFYADLAGGPGALAVAQALRELEPLVSRLKILGGYPRAPRAGSRPVPANRSKHA